MGCEVCFEEFEKVEMVIINLICSNMNVHVFHDGSVNTEQSVIIKRENK
jgi:hypothetical protein